ncbi:DNA mismatch repair endonuclease MutL [Blautia glucerasea]|uniref:DNA mismatch repair endonuclease MutL n=1 Tax=Blautia glucerasea TaxID=536633 RepID=UPI00156D92D2|nr:DNA mismatch repair endonuclease MutL [Blautia glucerasea]NSJ27357.1 DNA mismatch repair endonuclease MutL [Blautia glucerasea]
MRKIAVLDKHTIDKIAAGEVVERPSSVVKELVENAIDAGATAVTVEIADGGKRLIRITDNGSGMEADQVPVAFLSHATSKIEKVEDLENIASLGFRGEALSSIAAVSQVELITKTPSALSGVRYVIEGGAEQSMEEMGAPEGTTFLVRNLFYNTPARSKFLKSDVAEGNYISSLMEQLALSHPEISFKYIQNKQVKLHTSGNYNVKDVIYNVYGRDIARALLEVSYENDFLKIQGYVGKPEISRGTRSFENYYINGRYVKNNIIAKAIEDAYKGFLMQHKFPFVSLHIQMTGNDLDVNVHPRKMEVRFARGPEVYDCIYEAVRNVLTHREMIPKVSPGPEETAAKAKTIVERKDIPEPFETKRLTQMQQNIHPVVQKDRLYEELPVYKSNTFTKAEEALFSGNLHKEESSANTTDPIDKQEPKIQESKTQKLKTQEISDSAINISSHKTLESEILKQEQEAPKQLELFEEKLLAPESRSRHRLIGQLFETYWLVEFDDRFFIIDQHAAHEKVNYERFVKQFKEQETHSQYLSPPLIVSLSLEEEASLLANREFFEKAGFEIEPFGGREYSISAVPADLYGFSEEDLFLEMLDNLAGEGEKDAFNIFTARLATMACKSAVKGNNKLSFQEADQLIDQLLTLNNPYHCPHGRPTIISMTKTEIEKKFKRII